MGGDWSAGWIPIQPADQTPTILSDKYQCRKDTAIFSWWWAHGCPKHVDILNRIVHRVGFIYEILTPFEPEQIFSYFPVNSPQCTFKY